MPGLISGPGSRNDRSRRTVMRVRARVNQADISGIKVGQHVTVGLDAYPDLSFEGRVQQISPIGTQSGLSPKVRNFVVLVTVDGASTT